MINSPLLPLAYDNSIEEPVIRGRGLGWGDNSIVAPLPLAYDNSIVEPLIRGVGGWAGVINSPLLPSAYDNSIVAPLPLAYDYGRVEPLIRGRGCGLG